MHQFITLLCSGHCPLCHLVTFDDQARPGQGDCCLVLLWDIDSVVRLSLKRRGWHFPLRCVSVLSHWTHCIAQTFDLLITLLTHVWFAYYIAQTFGLLITLLTRLICSQFLYFSFYYHHWLSTRHLSILQLLSGEMFIFLPPAHVAPMKVKFGDEEPIIGAMGRWNCGFYEFWEYHCSMLSIYIQHCVKHQSASPFHSSLLHLMPVVSPLQLLTSLPPAVPMCNFPDTCCHHLKIHHFLQLYAFLPASQIRLLLTIICVCTCIYKVYLVT